MLHLNLQVGAVAGGGPGSDTGRDFVAVISSWSPEMPEPLVGDLARRPGFGAYEAAYRRIPRPGIAYEHTMFTSTPALRGVTDEHGWSEWASVAHPAWKAAAPLSGRPESETVTIDFSDRLYRVRWLYRRDTNDYTRELAGDPDVDAATGTVIRAATISIMIVPRVEGRTAIHEDTWTYDDVGGGPAWVVEDGTATPATWRKASRSDRLVFTDRDGKEIAMNRGPQWIEIVPPTVAPAFQ